MEIYTILILVLLTANYKLVRAITDDDNDYYDHIYDNGNKDNDFDIEIESFDEMIVKMELKELAARLGPDYEPHIDEKIWERSPPDSKFDVTLRLPNEIKSNWFISDRYWKMAKSNFRSDMLQKSVGITVKSTNDTIFYGSNFGNDFISMNGHLKYAAGRNGSDIYKLTYKSSKYIWINNYAADKIIDFLEIKMWLAETCTSYDSSVIQKTEFDIVVCLHMGNSVSTKYVMLLNYLKSDSYRHLIFKDTSSKPKKACSMLVPGSWLPPNNLNNGYYLNKMRSVYSVIYNDTCVMRLGDLYFYGELHHLPIIHLYENSSISWRNLTLTNDYTRNEAIYVNINDGRGNENAFSMQLWRIYNYDGTIIEQWRDQYFIILFDNNPKPEILTIKELLSSSRPYSYHRDINDDK